MSRRDPAYWQRLRKDRRSNVAAGFAVVAGLVATLTVIAASVPGSHSEARANPLYWLLMLPLVWWANALAAFEPRAVRIWRPALALACLADAACLALTVGRQEDWTAGAVSLAIVLAAAAASLAAHRGSLVAREGPAR
ncbi:MAG: hypothetical protein PGN34_20780 [Methylobacterium frigidaeris]